MLMGTGAATADDLTAVPTTELIATAPAAHPATLYMLSARLMEEGRPGEAAGWMYAGQLRYRFLLSALRDRAGEERVLFAALTESIGRPINETIAGDPDEWIAAMEWALEWDATHENALTSKAAFAAELATIRSGLASLIKRVDANRQMIRQEREANGLPNR